MTEPHNITPNNKPSTGRYKVLFTDLATKKEGAFVPFVVLGDPDFDTSYEIITTLIDNGADALELGIPFSDPLADGPEIQAADIRAFASGMTVKRSFELLKTIRDQHPTIPIGLLLYSNLVYKKGLANFYQEAQQVGVDSVLVADVPIREYDDYHQAALKYGIDPVLICPPNASEETFLSIAKKGRGYTYLVTRTGVTGADNTLSQDVKTRVKELEKAGAPPVIQGFGISSPEQVEFYLKAGVKGVISGSAVTRIIREHHKDKATMLSKLATFVKSMKAATHL